jgi:hypothetical protein
MSYLGHTSINFEFSTGSEVFKSVHIPIIVYVEKSDGQPNRLLGSKLHISVIYERISIMFGAWWLVQLSTTNYNVKIGVCDIIRNAVSFPASRISDSASSNRQCASIKIFPQKSDNLRKFITWLFKGERAILHILAKLARTERYQIYVGITSTLKVDWQVELMPLSTDNGSDREKPLGPNKLSFHRINSGTVNIASNWLSAAASARQSVTTRQFNFCNSLWYRPFWFHSILSRGAGISVVLTLNQNRGSNPQLSA